MYITYLYLKNFERMFLGNITELIYKPEQKIQVILGKNGIGKSSLFTMLTPLPVTDMKNDFSTGGYKEIHITHKNNNYVLISGKDASNKHNFIMNGIELNTGGTKKIQTELVKEHFGITQKIQDNMLDLRKFTDMGPNERKEWITQIATVDYSYALKLYNDVKQRHRDLVGSIVVEQSDLANIESTTYDSEEIKHMRMTIDNTQIVIDKLLESIVAVPSDMVVSTVDSAVANTLTKRLDKYSKDDKDNVHQRLIQNKTLLASTEERIKKMSSDLEKMAFVEDNKSVMNEKEIIKQLERLENDRNDITKTIYPGLDVMAIESIYELFMNIYPDMVDLLTALSDMQGPMYSLTQKSKVNHEYENAHKRLKILKESLTLLESKKQTLEHNKTHNGVKCDACGNTWSLGFNEKEYQAVLSDIEENNRVTFTVEKEISTLEGTIGALTEKESVIRDLKHVMNRDSKKLLTPIWDQLHKKCHLIDEPTIAMEELYAISTLVASWLDLVTIAKDIETLHKDHDSIQQQHAIKKEIYMLNKEAVEKELSEAYVLKHTLKKTIEEDEVLKKLIVDVKETHDKLVKYMRVIHKNTRNKVKRLRNEALRDIVNKLRLEMSEVERKISVSERQQQRKKDAVEKIERLKSEIEAHDRLIKVLSPSAGLIAKSIMHFINAFINDMNDIINSVWNYRIDILPCSIEDNDLNYRFPVKVDGRKDIKDVSYTSSSMKEIIDLAFKIASMKYLGFENYPLFLDEYAKTMDDTHRITAYEKIEELSRSWFSQIFIISHFETGYSRFNHADFNVLSSDNLMLNTNLETNRVLELK